MKSANGTISLTLSYCKLPIEIVYRSSLIRKFNSNAVFMIATHPCYDSGNRWPARPHLIVSASRLHAGPRPSRLLSCRKRNIKRRWVRFNFNLKNTLFASASVNLHPDPPFSSEHLRRRGCAWAGYFCSDRSDLSLSTKTDVNLCVRKVPNWSMIDLFC